MLTRVPAAARASKRHRCDVKNGSPGPEAAAWPLAETRGAAVRAQLISSTIIDGLLAGLPRVGVDLQYHSRFTPTDSRHRVFWEISAASTTPSFVVQHFCDQPVVGWMTLFCREVVV